MDFVFADPNTEYWCIGAGSELLEVEDSMSKKSEEVAYDGRSWSNYRRFAGFGFW